MKSHPVVVLRCRLADDPELKTFASQAGFAKLIGRSGSLIRQIESGAMRTSGKLVRAIADRTGVDPAWISLPEAAMDAPIPARDGGKWEPRMVIDNLRNEERSGTGEITDWLADDSVAVEILAGKIGRKIEAAIKADLAVGEISALTDSILFLRDLEKRRRTGCTEPGNG